MMWSRGRWPAAVGGVVWLAFVVWHHPSPFEIGWGVSLLLLSPLVLVPLGLLLADQFPSTPFADGILRQVARYQLPAATLAATAFLMSEGVAAALLCGPWWIVTGLIALAGVDRIRWRGLSAYAANCFDAGLVYVVIGAGWLVMSRAGLRPLDFPPVIVLLTAMHFHHAGFVLPLLAGLAADADRGGLARAGAMGVVAGVPLVAVGITATQLGLPPVLESVVVTITSASAFLVAMTHLRLAAHREWPRKLRVLFAVAGTSLAISMLLALTYGWRFFLPVQFLDIPWMRATHGTANAFGFALTGMIAWNLRRSVTT
jgi:hypothetical protein